MKISFSKITQRIFPGWRDQRGITGLETAIVLIAFVVVASVFAFTVLSTGLFASDKARDTINAGVTQARGTMELRGAVLATADVVGAAGVIQTLSFQVSNAAGGAPMDLTQGKTIIKYSDKNQSKNLVADTDFSVTGIGSADTDKLLEPGEILEIKLLDMDTLLTTKLGVATEFTLEVVPQVGAILFIQRTTPGDRKSVV